MRRLWPQYVLPITSQWSDIQWLEVGSFEGRTALWTVDNLLRGDRSSITCVDVWEVWPYHDGERDFNYETTFDRNAQGIPQIIKRKGRSRDILPALPPRSFHGIFLDGSHEEADVLEDAQLAFSLLRSDGLLIFDDYDWTPMPKGQPFIDDYMRRINTGVRRAADTFLIAHKDDVKVICRDYQVICQRVG